MAEQESRRTFMKTAGASGAAAMMGSLASGTETGAAETGRTIYDIAGLSGENVDKIMLSNLTRKEVREWFASGDLKVAIIPTGSTEQHNEHMALSMDNEASMVISKLTALKLWPNAVVTPPVLFGICPFFMKRRGTITIREEIFNGLVHDIAASMKTHGIEAIMIVNGHGGNTRALRKIAGELSAELGIPVEAHAYWESIGRDQRMEFTDSGSVPGHADELETSFAKAAFPERLREVDYIEDEVYSWEPDEKDLERVGWFDARWFSKEFDRSSFDEAKLATAGKGEKVIRHSTAWFADRITAMLG